MSSSASPTFEADFRDLRDARGLSLEDLHHETRIPVDVLRRFESGALLADDSFSNVYFKAFVKSVAKALGVPQAQALDAFDAATAGRYSGQLRADYAPPKAAPPPSRPDPEPVAPEAPRAGRPPAEASGEITPDTTTPGGTTPRPDEPTAPPEAVARDLAPAVAALKTGGTAVPSVQAPRASNSTAPTATRVQKPIVPSARRSFDKNWGTLGALAFVLLAVCAAAVYFLVFRGDSEPDDAVVATGESVNASQPDTTASAGPSGPRLQVPITVTAEATDGGLQWFRVTQDSEERAPNWIDAGSEQTFSADSTLILWGEGNASDTAFDFNETTLVLQGFRWRPATGQPVRITLQTGQALLDSLAGAGAPTSAPAPADAQ